MPNALYLASGLERVNELDSALWEQMLHALGRAVVERQTDDWTAYFNHLRHVFTKVVATTAISDLDDSDKAILIRRLMDRINELEKSWSAPKKLAVERLTLDRFGECKSIGDR